MFRSKKKHEFKKPASNYSEMLIGENTPFAISESFKMLRQNLFFTSSGESCPVYAISSSYAHVGKSVIIANTAASFAELGKKVLLIDADMRCPVLHRIFEKNAESGLSELLASVTPVKEMLDVSAATSGKSGLDLITSGRIPPNPSELLSSQRMEELIGLAKERYDVIFIDMPPICEVSDALAVSSFITGYIFAVRAGSTDDRSISNALDILDQLGARVVGFVLNGVDPKSPGKTYGKYGKYTYRRGDKEI